MPTPASPRSTSTCRSPSCKRPTKASRAAHSFVPAPQVGRAARRHDDGRGPREQRDAVSMKPPVMVVPTGENVGQIISQIQVTDLALEVGRLHPRGRCRPPGPRPGSGPGGFPGSRRLRQPHRWRHNKPARSTAMTDSRSPTRRTPGRSRPPPRASVGSRGKSGNTGFQMAPPGVRIKQTATGPTRHQDRPRPGSCLRGQDLGRGRP